MLSINQTFKKIYSLSPFKFDDEEIYLAEGKKNNTDGKEIKCVQFKINGESKLRKKFLNEIEIEQSPDKSASIKKIALSKKGFLGFFVEYPSTKDIFSIPEKGIRKGKIILEYKFIPEE